MDEEFQGLSLFSLESFLDYLPSAFWCRKAVGVTFIGDMPVGTVGRTIWVESKGTALFPCKAFTVACQQTFLAHVISSIVISRCSNLCEV